MQTLRPSPRSRHQPAEQSSCDAHGACTAGVLVAVGACHFGIGIGIGVGRGVGCVAGVLGVVVGVVIAGSLASGPDSSFVRVGSMPASVSMLRA
jgi:hypothetical protein